MLFDIAICTIFARECLEGSIVIGQYRTVLLRSPSWQEPARRAEGLKAITRAAVISAIVAFLICVATIIPLAIHSKDFDANVSTVIEGVSKVVAAICIFQLSLKLPKWLEVYARKNAIENKIKVGLTLRSIYFNVSWNIWREVGETGVFLIPYFLHGDGVKAIPLSGIVGIFLGLLVGVGLYYANKKLEKKNWLAFFMSTVTGFLAIGLFVDGCHKFEKVWGMSPVVWEIKNSAWSETHLPMTILKPFGYSAKRTVLQLVLFWSSLLLLVSAHAWKYYSSKKSNFLPSEAHELELENNEKTEETVEEPLENL